MFQIFQVGCIVPRYQLPVFLIFASEYCNAGIAAKWPDIGRIDRTGSVAQHPLDSAAMSYQQQPLAAMLLSKCAHKSADPVLKCSQ